MSKLKDEKIFLADILAKKETLSRNQCSVKHLWREQKKLVKSKILLNVRMKANLFCTDVKKWPPTEFCSFIVSLML